MLADTFHVPIAPHVSLGLGPQLAAGLHLAAATANLARLEYNGRVYDIANRFLRSPLPGNVAEMKPPTGPVSASASTRPALAPVRHAVRPMVGFEGVFPIVNTTFRDDGSLDLASQRRLVHFLLDCGAHGLGLFGTASEGYTLSADERCSSRG